MFELTVAGTVVLLSAIGAVSSRFQNTIPLRLDKVSLPTYYSSTWY